MRHLALASVGIVAAGIAGNGVAQSIEFPANHLFVSDYGSRVVEFDESGAIVRVLDLSPSVQNSSALAFGPEGWIWVGDAASDEIKAFDATNALAATIGHPSILAAEALEFDTFGRPLVISAAYGDLLRLSLDGASSTLLHDASSLLFDLEIDRGGFLLVSEPSSNLVRLVDVGGTSWLSNDASLSTLTPDVVPRGLAIERNGGISVGDSGTARIVFESDWIGSTPTTMTIPADAGDLEDVDYGPNGGLFVATGIDGRILLVDRSGNSTETFATLPVESDLAVYLAFAPFRFDVRAKGRVTVSDGAIVEIDENAVFSLQPSGRKACLHFSDDATDASDFVTLTGHDRFVVFGEPSAFEAPGNRRTMLARAPRSEDSTEDISLFCDWKRSLDDHGFERVNSAKGSLWFADPDLQVHLTFKTKTLRNP